ncbi:MAG: protein kinase [Pirellulales bacterium]
MNNQAENLSTNQKRKLYEICWQFEKSLEQNPNQTIDGFLQSFADTSEISSELLTAELNAILDERLEQKNLKRNSTYRPPDDQRYQLIEEIARGGSAVVWRMRDQHLQRDTAVKCLLDSHNNRQMRIRLEREARLCARLVHPGIVPIHELSQFSDGRPFVSMKLVEGSTFQQLLDSQSSITSQAATEVFLKVCQAMAFAHQQHIIHRDLKPSNIMVGKFGEVQIMDWGLAKALHNGLATGGLSNGIKLVKATASNFQELDLLGIARQETSVVETIPQLESTMHGMVFGTLSYMAPEQAKGEVEALDTRCDVFALGAILCRILTGHAPYHDVDQATMLKMAQRADMASTLSELRSNKFRELAVIAISCLSALPDNRPNDAAEVALLIERAVASSKRRKIARSFFAASLVLLLGLGFFAWNFRESDIDGLSSNNSTEIEGSVANDQARLADLAIPSVSTFKEMVQSKQYDHAIKYYQKVVEANPDDRNLMYVTAAMLMNTQRFEEAEPLALRYIELDPNQHDGYYLLGQSLYWQGKIQQSKQHYLKCRELKEAAGQEIQTLDDKLVEVERELLIIHQLSEQPIENFLSLPSSELTVVAKVCNVTHRYSDAVTLYEKLIASEPTSLKASIVRFNALLQFSRRYLLSDLPDPKNRNLIANKTAQWMVEQLSFLDEANSSKRDEKELQAAASQLFSVLKTRPELQTLRIAIHDVRIEEGIRQEFRAIFERIDALSPSLVGETP